MERMYQHPLSWIGGKEEVPIVTPKAASDELVVAIVETPTTTNRALVSTGDTIKPMIVEANVKWLRLTST
jgi:hypothetical protein